MMPTLHPSVFFAKKKRAMPHSVLTGDPPGPGVLRDCRRRRGESSKTKENGQSCSTHDLPGSRRSLVHATVRDDFQRRVDVLGRKMSSLELRIDGKQQSLIEERS